jgi:hypothetical protein
MAWKGKRKIDIKEETWNQRDYQSKERERIKEICSLWSAVTTFNLWGNWLDSFQLKVVDFVYLGSLYINILKIEQERYYKK